jgi:two-component system, OmpR family, response regulator CpxR
MIDDDTELCSLLEQFFREKGIESAFAHNGRAGLERLQEGGIDLIILDVMLPGADGFEVLKKIRKENAIPVIMLTARGEDVDRIIGLELGADDYLPKPFNARELLARIRAVLRRERNSEQGPERLEVGDVVMDVGARAVVCADRPVELTTLEFDILEMLLRAAGRVLTRDQIMEKLYDRSVSPFDRSIDLHVSHLRKKLGNELPRIKTVRGNGYQFVRASGMSGANVSPVGRSEE